jgi:phytoene/squalene synthetase
VSTLAKANDICLDTVRRHDKDQFLATLFCPAPVRPALFALYAFTCEINRIPESVTNPLAGEIRLRWWCEALSGERHEEALAHPVFLALDTMLTRFHLPCEPLQRLVEAKIFDLYDDVMPSLTDWEGYLGETVSLPFRYASLILNEGNEPGRADRCGHAGIAHGLVRFLQQRNDPRWNRFVPDSVYQDLGLSRLSSPVMPLSLQEYVRGMAIEHMGKAQTGEGIRILEQALLVLEIDALMLTSPSLKTGLVRKTWALWNQNRKLS